MPLPAARCHQLADPATVLRVPTSRITPRLPTPHLTHTLSTGPASPHFPPGSDPWVRLQHHHLKSLQMSAIERHFYSRQHQECVAKARAALSSQLLAAATAAAAAHDGVAISDSREAGAGAAAAAEAGAAPASPPAVRLPPAATAAAGFEDRALTRREEASLLHPLLRLRQACCHPQVRAWPGLAWPRLAQCVTAFRTQGAHLCHLPDRWPAGLPACCCYGAACTLVAGQQGRHSPGQADNACAPCPPNAPQVGGAGIRAVGPAGHNRSPMTMGEVLEVMLAKARVEAEDAQVGLLGCVLCVGACVCLGLVVGVVV